MDILPDRLVYCYLGKIGVVVLLCHYHFQFHGFASLRRNDGFQLILGFGIVHVGFAQEILKLHVKHRLACSPLYLGMAF